MALTKVTRSGITDNSINAAKIEDGTVVDADITPGTLTATKLASTLDLSSKTVTLPNTSVTNAMLAGSIANAKLANSSITIGGAATALGGSVNAPSLAWQSVVVSDGSTVTTMVAGRGYFVNNTSAAGIVKLPASAVIGDTIVIKDYAGNFGTNNLLIQRNGHNIQGVTNDSKLTTNRAAVVLVYVDATKGWLYQKESNVADLQAANFTEATGGTVTDSGDFRTHVFTGDGNFVVSQIGNAPVAGAGPAVVDYLVVAGGGGAGLGGAGAGGFRESHSTPVSGSYTASPLATPTGITLTVQTYPITVGAGGAANSNPGSNSIFSTITSAGGGRDSSYGGSPGPGGSGGGGGFVNPNNAAGAGNTPPVSPPQGNPGGSGTTAVSPANAGGGGGGGGAGASGQPGGNNDPGNGGNGVSSEITGSSVTRAGGGGSGGFSAPGGTGGSGGGGNGGTGPDSAVPNPPPGTAGSANTGGGAGGFGRDGVGNAGSAAAGGKGIVVIRYKYK